MHLRHKQILINERKRLLKFDYYFSQQRTHSNPFFRDEKWISVYQREKRTAQEARKVWAIYGLIRGINMDKPEGGRERNPKCEGFACLRAPPSYFHPFYLQQHPDFPLKPRGSPRNRWDFPPGILPIPGWEYRHVVTKDVVTWEGGIKIY